MLGSSGTARHTPPMVPLVFGIGLLCFTKSHVLFNMAIAINKGECSPIFYPKNKAKCCPKFNFDIFVTMGDSND